MKGARIFFSLLTAGGCRPGPVAPEDIIWEEQSDLDEGSLCLTTSESPSIETLGVVPQRFEAGRPLSVHYDAAKCFDGCDRNIDADATVTLSAHELAVETTLRWERAAPQDGLACVLVCEQFDAVFAVDPLPEEGTYTLVFAGQERDFEVPSDDIVCLGTRAPGETSP